jgi:hypothetical protein
MARGGGKTAELDDRGECPKLIEIETAHLKASLMDV